MKLEQQVVSLELAQKLKELGVKQESLFYWYWFKNTDGRFELKYAKSEPWNGDMQAVVNMDIAWSAFTVAELGEMIAEYTGKSHRFHSYKGRDAWFAEYESHLFEADTEADARGKMLVYLLENKLITL